MGLNLEEKIKRLSFLNSQEWLSDQDHEEREQLEKELSIIKNDLSKLVSKVEDKKITEVLKQTPRSKALNVIKKLIFPKPKTPATREEIKQLELELQKAQLTREIALAKEQTPRKSDKIFKALGTIVKAVGSEATKPHQKKPIKIKKLDNDWWKKDKWNIKL